MRVKTFYRLLRSITYFVLFFFCWSYLELFQIPAAYASTNTSGAKGQKAENSGREAQKTTEGKFQESFDRLREAGSDRTKLRAERGTIEQLDTDLQKQFKETEARIKDLPNVIRQRHRDFTKKYSENFSTLKTHLDSVEKAKTDAEAKVAGEKAIAFLEKTKTPTRHIKLDPNNLPHRTVKGKEKTPRSKKEEFERDFPQKKPKNKQRIASSGMPFDLLANRPKQKPILLAFNEPASDIPLSVGARALTPQYAFADSAPFLLAQAADAPTAEELAETPEVQFTDDIRAKAEELGKNPVRIYEWVRNNIEFVPTYGSIQGADMCLQTKQCNGMDTTSLLIALLRASNISARYVYGTIEVPIDKIKNWVGGFTDSTAAMNFVVSGGIPAAAGQSGGVITKARLEHVWVEANVAYGPYSGRPSNLNPDKIWVPLDPSFKQYTYTEGIDLQAAVPFDAQIFANQIQSTATISETAGYVTNVDSTFIQTTMTAYQTQIQNYIDQNMPNATTGDIIGKKEIKKQELGILPATLPYKVTTLGTKYSEVPDNLRHKVIFEVQDSSAIGNSLSYTASIPEIAGKRVTLSYAPATAADEQVINNYGGIFNVPAYMVAMKSQIKIDGVTTASGSGIGLGNQQTFNLKFSSPNSGVDIISNNVTAGAYYGIGVIPNNVTQEILRQRSTKVENIRSAACSNLSTDDCIGELLYSTALAYFYDIYALDECFKQKFEIADMHHVSEGIVSKNIDITYFWNVPIRATEASMMIDVDRIVHSAVSRSGDVTKERQFTITAGQMSSAMEHGIFEQLYQAKGVSTIQLLQAANNQGIPIYAITQNNISTVLPRLAISNDIKNDIQNAVNSGKNIIIPEQNITYYSWSGVGYIVLDPVTGSGAYMISANLANGGQCVAAGGCTSASFNGTIFVDAFTALGIVAFLEPAMLLVEYAMAELLLLGPVGWAAFAFFAVFIVLLVVLTYFVASKLQEIEQQTN